MAKWIILICTGLLCIMAGAVHADWSMDFVRITCIPEARYFQFEYKPVSGPAALLETELDKNKRNQRLSTWQKHGYYDPSMLQYECRLPESTYRVSAVQPPAQDRGECGADPQITLSLFRNGKPILDKVVFGDDCFGGPSVLSVEITDGLKGWDTRQMTLCLSPKTGTQQVCKFLSETYNAISKAIPINQEKVGKYVEEKRREQAGAANRP